MIHVLARSEVSRRREDSAIVRRRYDRIAGVYDLLEGTMELLALTRWRRLLWQRVGERPGRVLEVGVGTGKNLPLWPAAADVMGIDLSGRMLARARRRARELRLSARFESMDVEALDLPDGSFDVAVASFVFCSVADPLRGLRELLRVLRPGGRLVLLEHQRSDSPLVARVLALLDPLAARLWGAHVDRPTEQTVRAAGFHVERVDFLTPAGMVRLIEARASGATTSATAT